MEDSWKQVELNAMKYILNRMYDTVANMDVVACDEHGQAVFVDDVLQEIENMKRDLEYGCI